MVPSNYVLRHRAKTEQHIPLEFCFWPYDNESPIYVCFVYALNSRN